MPQKEKHSKKLQQELLITGVPELWQLIAMQLESHREREEMNNWFSQSDIDAYSCFSKWDKIYQQRAAYNNSDGRKGSGNNGIVNFEFSWCGKPVYVKYNPDNISEEDL